MLEALLNVRRTDNIAVSILEGVFGEVKNLEQSSIETHRILVFLIYFFPRCISIIDTQPQHDERSHTSLYSL